MFILRSATATAIFFSHIRHNVSFPIFMAVLSISCSLVSFSFSSPSLPLLTPLISPVAFNSASERVGGIHKTRTAEVQHRGKRAKRLVERGVRGKGAMSRRNTWTYISEYIAFIGPSSIVALLRARERGS